VVDYGSINRTRNRSLFYITKMFILVQSDVTIKLAKFFPR